MSPRRTRAATVEQSAVSTRSKAQRINNVNQDVAKSAQKVRQSQRKEKSGKSNMEAAKQSAKKESPDVEVIFQKSAKKKTSRRRLHLNKVETEDVDQNVDSNESIRILRDRYCDNVTTVELVRHNFLQLNASKDLDSEKIPNGKLQQKMSAKISPIIVTPKSTPPKLSLTPHRSKKTPKKSPISLGSPKTHSIAIPKLFKSPRKLSLAATGEDSEESLEKSESDSHAKKSRKSKKNSPNNSSGSDKSTSISPTEKKKHKKSDINLKATVRKFSKSPKIVLKSPKSKKSKSRKLKLLSPSRVKKSPSKTSPSSPGTSSNLNTSSPRIRIKKSPLSKGKNLSSIKRRLLNSKLTNTLTTSQIKDVLAEPIVLLEKLSPENLKQKNIVASETRSDTFIIVRSPSIRGGSSSKVLTPIKKASVSMSPKQNSSPKLRNSSMEKSRISNTNRVSPRIKYNTSIPLMSSTPREGKVTSMDTSLVSNTSIASVNNTSLNTRLRHRSQSNVQLSNTMDKNTDIKNVSRPLFDKEINDTSQSLLSNVTRRNATYDKDNTMEKKQESNRDNTYELEQPQTISLRQMIKKRTSTEANLSSKDNTKKAKVRFAVGTSGGGSARKSVNKLNGSRSSISHDVSAQNRSNIMNSVSKSKKVETPKLAQNSLFSPFKRSSPRNHGGTPRAQLSRVQVTPKTFASTEKKSEKKSSTKKVPNFSRIHEQMFAKSESLVDAKKRLEARHGRHLAFKLASTKTAVLKPLKGDVETEEKKLLPTDTRDGIHNRFGFKLKKSEATNIMLKKQPVFSRQKQQHETRKMLQGVRTNRRFELQMKARNVNS